MSDRINRDFTTSFPSWTVWMVVCVGIGPVSQFVVESAFEFGFRQENNLSTWRKCGAVPLTRCCLKNHSQVRWEMGYNHGITNQMIQDIQTANVARHQRLIERQMGNIIKNMSLARLILVAVAPRRVPIKRASKKLFGVQLTGTKKFCLSKQSPWMACRLLFVLDGRRTGHNKTHRMVCGARWRSCDLSGGNC